MEPDGSCELAVLRVVDLHVPDFLHDSHAGCASRSVQAVDQLA